MTQVVQRKQRLPIARINGLWTPQSAAISDPPMPQPAAFWPSPPTFSGNDSLFLVASITRYYYCYSFTFPGGMEGWVGL